MANTMQNKSGFDTDNLPVEVWQIERFLQNVHCRIQEGSVWLSINRQYTFKENEWEHDGRWAAEDLIGALLVSRPWVVR